MRLSLPTAALTIAAVMLMLLPTAAPPPSLAQSDAPLLVLHTNGRVYAPLHVLQIYGSGLPDETLIVRVFAPDGSIVRFDQTATEPDGSFDYVPLTWPQPSADFAFGTYTVEVISTKQNGLSQKVNVKFLPTADLQDVPVERRLDTLVFAPETAAAGQPLRVFIQVTSDGLLVGGDPSKLLDATHVHLPSGLSVPLAGSLGTLHQGLFFADYVPAEEGTHVFHAAAYSGGTTSHGSAATAVLSQDLGGISEQILRLNSVLNATSSELDTLKSEMEGFDATLAQASKKIDTGTVAMSKSVGFIGEASSQLNSLLFPIIGSIGIIVALQVAILARRR